MGVNTDLQWMQRAYALAHQAAEQGEVPVGAVLVVADGQCVAEGYNQMIQRHDPTAHAEMMALRAAGIARSNYRLNDTTLYVTLEPCCMCAGALIHARIARLVYAAPDPRAGAAGSCFNFIQDASLNHVITVESGPLLAECATLLVDFFKKRR